MCLASCSTKSKAERIKRRKITVSAPRQGRDARGGWWRWRTLSLLPLRPPGLHPELRIKTSGKKRRILSNSVTKSPFPVAQRAAGGLCACRARAMPALGSRGRVRSAAAAAPPLLPLLSALTANLRRGFSQKGGSASRQGSAGGEKATGFFLWIPHIHKIHAASQPSPLRTPRGS